MSCEFFIVVCAAVFVVTKFILVPRYRNEAFSAEGAIARRSRAKLAVAGLAAMAALMAGVASAVFYVIVNSLLKWSPEALAEVEALQGSLSKWLDRAVFFGQGWLILLGLAILLGIAVYVYRRSLVSYEKAHQLMIEREVARISEQAANGTLKELQPTNEMEHALGYCREAEEKLEALRQLADENEDLRSDAETAMIEIRKNQEEAFEHVRFLDLQRRVDFKIAPAEMGLPPAEGFWERFGTIFISRGMVSGLSRSARWMVTGLAALAAVSLIGISSGSLSDQMNEKIVDLDERKVQLTLVANREEASRSYESAMEKLAQAPAQAAEAEDEQLADESGAQFEARLIRASIGTPKGDMDEFTRTARKLRALSTKQAILQEHASRDPNLEFQGDAAPEVKGKQAEILETYERALKSGSKPQTEAGKAMSRDIRTHLGKSGASVRDQFRTGLKSLQQTLKPSDLEWVIMRELAGEAMDPKGKGSPTVMGDAHESVRKDVFSQVAGGKPVQGAFDSVETRSYESFYRGDEISGVHDHLSRRVNLQEKIDSLKAAEVDSPSLRERTNPERMLKAKNSAIKTFVKMGGGDRSYMIGEFSMGYENHFPATRAGVDHGLHGELTKSWQNADDLAAASEKFRPYESAGGGVGGGAGSSSAAKAKPIVRSVPSSTKVTASVGRARSFTRLSGFSRIGGVLIGSMPKDANTGATFSDISWSFDGSGRFVIELTTGDGKSLKSKAVDAELIYRALGYSADGRPVTVTMVSAQPLAELKILLHPALLDTKLGNDMIELDRYVDTFCRGPQTNDVESFVNQAHAAYQIAWAARARAVVAEVTKDVSVDEKVKEQLVPLDRFAASILDDPEVQELAEGALMVEPEKLLKASPLRKAEFYDRGLVKWIVDFNKSPLPPGEAGKAKRLADHVVMQTGKIFSNPTVLGNSARNVLYENFNTPPPTYQVWSGVRERDYDLKTEAMVIGEDRKPGDVLRFMLQVAFTSAPGFGSEKDSEEYVDQDPWEFTSLAQGIEEAIMKQIEADTVVRAVCERAADFTVLQRIFRNAFEGNFGVGFPVEKLRALSEESLKFLPPSEHTPRWNPRPGAFEARIDLDLKELSQVEGDAGLASLVSRLSAISAERRQRAAEFQKSMLTILAAAPMSERKSPEWTARWAEEWEKSSAKDGEWLERMRTELDAFMAGDPPSAARINRLDMWFDFIELRQSAGVVDEDAHQLARITPEKARQELRMLGALSN